jgi:hypothetical protein
MCYSADAERFPQLGENRETGTSLEDFMPISLGLPLQQQFATRNNVGTTSTCRATAARLSLRPVRSGDFLG